MYERILQFPHLLWWGLVHVILRVLEKLNFIICRNKRLSP